MNFLYEAPRSAERFPAIEDEALDIPAALAAGRSDFLRELTFSVKVSDLTQITERFSSIQETHPQLAKALNARVKDFEYEAILQHIRHAEELQRMRAS